MNSTKKNLKKIKKYHYLLLALFLFVLTTRLFLAFSTPNFTYDSYFHLKHINHLTHHGLPLYQDPLSYGGRTLTFLPAFHYFLSFFDLFLPLEFAAKLIPNLLFSLLIPLTFLLAKRITKDWKASLFSSLVAGFIPIFWQTNSISPASFFLPLTMIAIYSFTNLHQKSSVYLYLVTIIILSFTTPLTFLLIIGLIFYLLLSKIEKKKTNKAELELTLISLLFFLWVQFLFFKNTLLTEGLSFIWQNIPLQIISQYFPPPSLLEALISISIIPFLAGIYLIYDSFFKEKNQKIFLLFSLAISTALFTWIKLIEFQIALMFFGLLLAILFSRFYQLSLNYFQQTKLNKFKVPFLILLILLISLTSIYPSFSLASDQQTPSPEEINAFLWLKKHTPSNSIILASLEEGHLLNYLSQRKNLMDTHFFLIKNIETRFDHLRSLFITKYQTQAVNLLDQHQINYIFFSPQAKKEFQTDHLAYLDQKCFELVYSNVVQIYKSKCRLEPTG